MPDIASITAVLTGLKTASEIAKTLRETSVSFEKAETKLHLAELMSALADAKISAADTQVLFEEKEQEIRALRDALETKARVVRHGDAYYETDDSGQPSGDPHCSRCWEVDHRPVHINQHPLDPSMSICPACKSTCRWQQSLTSGPRT